MDIVVKNIENDDSNEQAPKKTLRQIFKGEEPENSQPISDEEKEQITEVAPIVVAGVGYAVEAIKFVAIWLATDKAIEIATPYIKKGFKWAYRKIFPPIHAELQDQIDKMSEMYPDGPYTDGVPSGISEMAANHPYLNWDKSREEWKIWPLGLAYHRASKKALKELEDITGTEKDPRYFKISKNSESIDDVQFLNQMSPQGFVDITVRLVKRYLTSYYQNEMGIDAKVLFKEIEKKSKKTVLVKAKKILGQTAGRSKLNNYYNKNITKQYLKDLQESVPDDKKSDFKNFLLTELQKFKNKKPWMKYGAGGYWQITTRFPWRYNNKDKKEDSVAYDLLVAPYFQFSSGPDPKKFTKAWDLRDKEMDLPDSASSWKNERHFIYKWGLYTGLLKKRDAYRFGGGNLLLAKDNPSVKPASEPPQWSEFYRKPKPNIESYATFDMESAEKFLEKQRFNKEMNDELSDFNPDGKLINSLKQSDNPEANNLAKRIEKDSKIKAKELMLDKEKLYNSLIDLKNNPQQIEKVKKEIEDNLLKKNTNTNPNNALKLPGASVPTTGINEITIKSHQFAATLEEQEVAKDVNKKPDQSAAGGSAPPKKETPQKNGKITKEEGARRVAQSVKAGDLPYNTRQRGHIQKKLSKSLKIPLSQIQANLINYFKDAKNSETFRKYKNLISEQNVEGKIVGDGNYGDETETAIREFQKDMIYKGYLRPVKEKSKKSSIDGLYGPDSNGAHAIFKRAQRDGNLKGQTTKATTKVKTKASGAPKAVSKKPQVDPKASTALKTTLKKPQVDPKASQGSKKIKKKKIKMPAKVAKIVKVGDAKLNSKVKKGEISKTKKIKLGRWLRIQSLYGCIKLDTGRGELVYPTKPAKVARCRKLTKQAIAKGLFSDDIEITESNKDIFSYIISNSDLDLQSDNFITEAIKAFDLIPDRR